MRRRIPDCPNRDRRCLASLTAHSYGDAFAFVCENPLLVRESREVQKPLGERDGIASDLLKFTQPLPVEWP